MHADKLLEWTTFYTGPERAPVYVSFFTDEFYMREAWDLVRSLEAHRLHHSVREIRSALPGARADAEWKANTDHKPRFLLERDEEFPAAPLVWLDADARVRSTPQKLTAMHASVKLAYHTWRGRLGRHGPCSGTVYLAPGPWRRNFLTEWIRVCEMNRHIPHATDQGAMSIAEANLGMGHFELPQEYCQIFDLTQGTLRPTPADGPAPVIEHMQASRWRKRLGVIS